MHATDIWHYKIEQLSNSGTLKLLPLLLKRGMNGWSLFRALEFCSEGTGICHLAVSLRQIGIKSDEMSTKLFSKDIPRLCSILPYNSLLTA